MESDPFPTQEVLAQAAWAQRVARAMVRDQHLAEDIAQDALEASLRRKTAPPGGLQAWLYGTLRNLRRQAARKEVNLRKRELSAIPAEPQAKPDELLERVEVQRAVIDAVIRLPEILRSALILRYYEDLSVREVARTLGVTEKAAELRIQRGIQQLRESFASRFGSSWILTVAPLLHSPAAAILATLVEIILMTAKSKYIVAGACALILMGAFVAFNGPDTDPVREFPGSSASTPMPPTATADIDREPALVATSAEGRFAEILAVDQFTKAPVDRVNVFVAQDGRESLLGFTNAEGAMRAHLPDSGGFTIRALAAGKAEWSRWFNGPAPESLLIELTAGLTIHGRVRTQDGLSAGPGIQVVAWAQDEFTTLATVQSWFDGEPASFPTALTDQNGEFVLNEVRAGVRYEICAGSNGLLARSAFAHGGDRGVTLALSTLYGAIVLIRTSEGLLPEMVFPFPGFSFTKAPDLFEADYSALRPHLLVAGVDVRNWLQHPEYDQAYFFLKTSYERNLGPLTYYLEFPGCEPEFSEIYVSRLADGISRCQLQLKPMSRSLGTIEFTFSGSTRSIKNPAGLFDPLASLYLTDSASQTCEYSVPDFDKPLQLTNLPHGDYSYLMILHNRILGDGPWAGSIHHQGAITTTDITVSQFGALNIKVLEANGEQRHSKRLIKLLPQFPGYKAIFNFQYPPFRIEGVPAGDYIVQVFSTGPKTVLAVESPIVTVRPGEVLEQALTLPD